MLPGPRLAQTLMLHKVSIKGRVLIIQGDDKSGPHKNEDSRFFLAFTGFLDDELDGGGVSGDLGATVCWREIMKLMGNRMARGAFRKDEGDNESEFMKGIGKRKVRIDPLIGVMDVAGVCGRYGPIGGERISLDEDG